MVLQSVELEYCTTGRETLCRTVKMLVTLLMEWLNNVSLLQIAAVKVPEGLDPAQLAISVAQVLPLTKR